MVDPFCDEEIFVFVFLSVGHSSALNDVIQSYFNSVVEVIEGFVLLGPGLDIVSKLLAEGALATVVWKVVIDLCRFGDITFPWSVLGSGVNCFRSVFAWPSLWC